MLVHASHAARRIVSRDDGKDSVANFALTVTTAKNSGIAGVWFSAAIHKNFTQAIRLDSIKHRKPAFGATPQRHHVMPCGRLPNAPIHGNLFGGLGGHPLRVAHLAETKDDASGLRLAVINRA